MSENIAEAILREGSRVEELIEAIGTSFSDASPEEMLIGVAEVLDSGEAVDVDELVNDLLQIAAHAQDREDRIIDMLRSVLSGEDGLIIDELRDMLADSDWLYELAEEHAAQIVDHQWKMMHEDTEYCPECDRVIEQDPVEQRLMQARMHISKLQKQLRMLELEVLELEVVARGALHERV